MKILVCGGRKFGCAGSRYLTPALKAQLEAERRFLFETLDLLYVEYGFTLVIHGDAQGADRLAGEWARTRGIHECKVPALWDYYHTSSGHRRNTEMLKLMEKRERSTGRSDMVVAFPGGRGTQDMVAKAKGAGYRVLSVSPGSLPVLKDKEPIPPYAVRGLQSRSEPPPA